MFALIGFEERDSQHTIIKVRFIVFCFDLSLQVDSILLHSRVKTRIEKIKQKQ